MSEPEQMSLFETAVAHPEPDPEEDRRPNTEDEHAPPPEVLREMLRRRLHSHLEGGLTELVLTDNRSVLLSGRPQALSGRPRSASGRGGWTVRIHWSFATAPPEVVEAAAAVLSAPRGSRSAQAARRAVRRWIDLFREETGPGPAPETWRDVIDARRRAPDAGAPAGHVHDLEAILDHVNRCYFDGRIEASITWGRAGRPGGRRRRRRRRGRTTRSTIKLGSWSSEDRLIRIHPVLDHTSVPSYVVASVVHHELLHAEMGTEVCGGRRRHHTPEFRRRERELPGHERARRWIREHMGELLERRARIA